MGPMYQAFQTQRKKRAAGGGSMNRMADMMGGMFGYGGGTTGGGYSSYDMMYPDQQPQPNMGALGPLAGMLVGQPGLFGALPPQLAQLYSYFGRRAPQTTARPMSMPGAPSRPTAQSMNAMANPYLRF